MWWNKKADKPESDTKYKVNQWVHTPYGDGRVVGIRDRYTSEPHYSVSIAGMPWDLWFFESQLSEDRQSKYVVHDWVETPRGIGNVIKVDEDACGFVYTISVCGPVGGIFKFYESRLWDDGCSRKSNYGYTGVDTEWAAGIDWSQSHTSKYKRTQLVETALGVGEVLDAFRFGEESIYFVKLTGGKCYKFTESELKSMPIYKFNTGDYVVRRSSGKIGKVKGMMNEGSVLPINSYWVLFYNASCPIWVCEDELEKGAFEE